ncbi:MAG: hypothetical protein IPM75_09820 [Candidatus Competibacteraceae bacterium]|nr:hypothetical protein [Candidatus Competibacteraceae bacterium]
MHGLQPGKLYVVSGRPGMGKSVLRLAIRGGLRRSRGEIRRVLHRRNAVERAGRTPDLLGRADRSGRAANRCARSRRLAENDSRLRNAVKRPAVVRRNTDPASRRHRVEGPPASPSRRPAGSCGGGSRRAG